MPASCAVPEPYHFLPLLPSRCPLSESENSDKTRVETDLPVVVSLRALAEAPSTERDPTHAGEHRHVRKNYARDKLQEHDLGRQKETEKI